MIFKQAFLYCRARKPASTLSLPERMIASLIEKLASSSLPGGLAEESKALDAELCHERNALRHALAWLICDVAFPCSYPGLLRYLGWIALSQYLRPLVQGIWQLAGRRSLAPRLLSYLWIIAGYGATGWSRSRASPASGLWPLQYALGIPENGLPVLRNAGSSPARGAGNRRRSRSAH